MSVCFEVSFFFCVIFFMDIFPFYEVEDLQQFLSEGKTINFETFTSLNFSLHTNVNFNSDIQTDIFDE